MRLCIPWKLHGCTSHGKCFNVPYWFTKISPGESLDPELEGRSTPPLNAAGSWIEPHVTAQYSHMKKSMPNKHMFVTII